MSGPVARREMSHAANPSAKLVYNIYRDAGRRQVWGNRLNADTEAFTFNGSESRVLSVYGRIPGHQDLHAGAYSDSLIVRVDF